MREDCRSETIKKCEEALDAAKRAGETLVIYFLQCALLELRENAEPPLRPAAVDRALPERGKRRHR